MVIKPFFTEFRFTHPLRNVFYFSLLVGLYSLIPFILQHFQPIEDVEKLSTGLETFLGLVLSLLLVFRANRAYERWWEARTNWGIFVHHLMIILFLFLPWKLIHTYQLWTVPLVIIIAYITFALEGIARNLEEPFGTTSDDVHMETISNGIANSTRQVLVDGN